LHKIAGRRQGSEANEPNPAIVQDLQEC
jgi:hypothetical protein